MIAISHRGNLSKINSNLENSPSYIDQAIKKGFQVEVDLRLINNCLLLGHDIPEYKIEKEYLLNRNCFLWIHCKNILALDFCLKNNLHCFYHQNDDVTLTSKGFIWTFPNSKLDICNISIAVLPEITENWNINNAYGICSDFIEFYV